MTVKINYISNTLKKNSQNIVLFVDEKFNISNIKKFISKNEYSYISDLLNINEKKKDIITYDISSKKKIILVSIKKKITISEIENLGAMFYKKFKDYCFDPTFYNN